MSSRMDIDDILASVDREYYTSPESTALDHQQLTRLWVAERAVSELLPWPGPLMERMMARVRTQIEMIEDLTASSYGGGDPDHDGSGQRSQSSQTLNLKLSILQTDLSRTQYLIRSFLRQRLAKITRFSMHYLLLISPDKNAAAGSQSQTTTTAGDDSQLPGSSSLLSSTDMDMDPGNADSRDHRNPTRSTTTAPLSPDEARFLQAHHSLLYNHYNASFLSTFPPQLRRLDDNAGGTNMVEGPDTKEIVFVRCLADEVTIVVPPDDILHEETYGTTMKMGEVWAVRWEGVKRAWERGEVEIL